MLKQKSFYIGTLILGLIHLAIGLILAIQFGEEVRPTIGVFIGIGAGLSTASIVNMFMKHLEDKNPEMLEQNKINFYDERNTFIRYKAKAKVADFMQYSIIGIAYVTIMISSPLWVTLLIVGIFVMYNILVIYFTNKYQKEL